MKTVRSIQPIAKLPAWERCVLVSVRVQGESFFRAFSTATLHHKGVSKVGKDSLFNQWYSDKWVTTHERMKLDPYLTLSTKINSKWISDLNLRAKGIKLLEENMSKSSQPRIWQWILIFNTKSTGIKRKKGKLDFTEM